MISRDPISRLVPTPLSPLSSLTLPSPFFAALRTLAHQTPLPSVPEAAAQRILLSAILHGALLDWRALAALAEQLPYHPFQNEWVDLQIVLPSGFQMLRRWFVDPVTDHLLSCMIDQLPSARQVEEWVERAAAQLGVYASSEWIMYHAQLWWRLRLPAAVADQAEGRLLAGAVPPANWNRITTGKASPVPKHEQTRRRSLGSPRLAQSSFGTTDPDWTALKSALKRLPAKGGDRHEIRQIVVAALQQVTIQSEIAGLLRSWMVACLTDGSHAVPPRRPGEPPVTPGTLSDDLAVLTPEFLSNLSNLIDNAPDLAEFYEDWISEGSNPSTQAKRLSRVRFFHNWLVAYAAAPSLQFEFDWENLVRPSHAALVSELDYLAARERADGLVPSNLVEPCRVALSLGFRAGLRDHELLAVRAADIRLEPDVVVLTVRPNRYAKAKSGNAQRAIPLHLLLTTDELAELSRYVLQTRRLGSTQGYLFPQPSAQFGEELRGLLEAVTQDANIRVYDLRHSFGSCLAATLLLPENFGWDSKAFPWPGFGPSCISVERRALLRSELLGGNSLGRGALFAIAALMGHAGPHRVLHSYMNLMDWVLQLYVAERHGAELKEPRFDRTVVRRLSPPTEPASGAIPQWRSLYEALVGLQEGDPPRRVMAQTGIGLDLLNRYAVRLRTILDKVTIKGTPRHRFGRQQMKAPAPDKRYRLNHLRADVGVPVLDRVWSTSASVLSDPDVQWALERWVARFDPERHDLPMSGQRAAIRFMNAMKIMGFQEDEIGLRFRPRGSDASSPWAAGPHNLTAIHRSDQIRIGLIVTAKGKVRTPASLRVAMVMLAIASP